MSVHLRYGARSDIGLVRKSNQDSGYAGPHLLVLADGMGGAAGGDIASSIAVAHLAPLDTDVHGADDLLDLLRKAVASAHAELLERTVQDEELAGLGTTCIAVLRAGNKLAMIHIGDSRAYVLRNGELTQVTTDHSFVQYLVQTGQLTEDAAAHHPQRSVLLRVLGDSEGDVTLDESVRNAVIGDRWLLCSDGLSGVVSHETIEEVLNRVADPHACAEELTQLALRGGGPDNITCVVADVVDDSDSLPSTVPVVVGAAAVERKTPTSAATSPAQKAAALKILSKNGASAASSNKDENAGNKPLKAKSLLRWIFTFSLISAMLLGLFFIGRWAYSWSQKNYFVDVNEEGSVAIFRGIPQTLGPLTLFTELKDTAIPLESWCSSAKIRLKNPVTGMTSPEEAEKWVTEQDKLCKGAPSPATTSPEGSASPVPTVPTANSPTPTTSTGP
ncbi:MAG: protein phosphatase 2C domain-containing protein [Actinomycetaceae bacterium]|nr:protein phosphatase 2C domain-containing protein [Actinomycetaceae bacterium]